MTAYWPETLGGIESAPDETVHQTIAHALQPLRPFVRGLTYHSEDATQEWSAVITFGGEAHQLQVRVLEGRLILDCPIGSVPQTPDNMLALLQLNFRRRWTFRVESSAPGARDVVVVIEHQTGVDQLPELAGLVLQAWREKVLNQAAMYDMRGEIDV